MKNLILLLLAISPLCSYAENNNPLETVFERQIRFDRNASDFINQNCSASLPRETCSAALQTLQQKEGVSLDYLRDLVDLAIARRKGKQQTETQFNALVNKAIQ